MLVIEPTKGHAIPNWSAINWSAVEGSVKRLQTRIYRAAANRETKKLKNLQKLLARSTAAKLLATRQVTQENRGKHTAGVDGVIATTAEARQQIANSLSFKNYRPKPVRRVSIPKKDKPGAIRQLGIPCLVDRVMQTLVKLALEPEWESRFETNSYGFRPGRGTMDAIEALHTSLNKRGCSEWIFDADIAQCFDSLSHTFLLSRLHSFKATIKSWLKAGVVEFGQTLATSKARGAPQGAPLSPLLMNIVLDGMERLFGSENAQGQHVTPSCRKGKDKGISLCRYADDFAVTAPSKEILEHYVRPKLEAFLKIRGLELSQAKTRIVHVEQGFHFLGFTIRRFKNKVLTLPQKDKVKAHVRAIRSYLRQHRQAPLGKVIKDLNPVLRGWANYYRHCAAKATFNKVDHLIWQKLWRWAKRRHPNKSARWVKARYFDEHWRLREGRYTLKRHQTTPIIRHVKVKAKASPMNPELKDYWSQRRIKQLAQKTYWYQHAELLRRQQGNCGLCGVTLNKEDPIDDHHILPRHQGGSDQLNNRMLVHIWCHQAYHQRHGYS